MWGVGQRLGQKVVQRLRCGAREADMESREHGRSHKAGFGLVELLWGECWGLLVGPAGDKAGQYGFSSCLPH